MLLQKSGVNCTEIYRCLEEECENKDMDFGLYWSEASESDSEMDLEDFDEFSSVDTDTDSVMDSEDFEGF